jgi:hypothetical protein
MTGAVIVGAMPGSHEALYVLDEAWKPFSFQVPVVANVRDAACKKPILPVTLRYHLRDRSPVAIVLTGGDRNVNVMSTISR